MAEVLLPSVRLGHSNSSQFGCQHVSVSPCRSQNCIENWLVMYQINLSQGLCSSTDPISVIAQRLQRPCERFIWYIIFRTLFQQTLSVFYKLQREEVDIYLDDVGNFM